jgi:hypothetical protein
MVDPIAVFSEVKSLAAGASDLEDTFPEGAIAVFPGPFHLASLLIAAGSALMESAVVNLPPPDGVPEDRWTEAMKTVAETRPYLWRNHKDAVAQGYLKIGTSAAIGFPTGAGCVPRKPGFPGFQELLRPGIVQAFSNPLAATQGGNALLATQARQDDPDLLFG